MYRFVFVLLNVLLLGWLPVPVVAQDAISDADAILIENITVIPIDRNTVLPAQDVLVRGGRIAAIRAHGSAAPEPDARRFDGSGLFLIPGLFDSHSHLTLETGEQAIEREDFDAMRAVMERRMETLLANGVTSIRDPGMAEFWLPLARDLRGRKDLPRLRFAGPIIDGPPTPWSNGMEVRVTAPEEAAAVVDRLAANGVDFLKIYHRVEPDSFAAIAAAADRNGLAMAGHVPFQITTEIAVTLGQRQLEHTYTNLFKDCGPTGNRSATDLLSAWMSGGYEGRWRYASDTYRARDEEACGALYQEFGEQGLFVTATPQLDLPLSLMVNEADIAGLEPAARGGCRATIEAQAGADPDVAGAWQADLAEHYTELRAVGVRFVAGSDAPTDCMGYAGSLARSVELFGKLGFSNYEALQTATSNAAAMAGHDDLGIIAEGAQADLLVLNANPLVNLSALRDVRAVMLRGKWVGEAPTSATLYRGGNVWNGSGFEARDFAVAEGRFIDLGRAQTTEVVDLNGQYVVPPYGNAHAHLTYPSAEGSGYFLDRGVFYVWNPNTVTLGPDAREFFARSDTVDVAVAQGGITTPGGHPEALYVDVLTKYAYPGKDRDWFLGNAFHYGRSSQEIGESLDELARQGADFVKAYLLHSQEFAMRSGSPDYRGNYGLDPAVVPQLVELAAARQLKTAWHVETATDLVLVAQAGAHMAAHLPGYSDRTDASGTIATDSELNDDQAQIVADSGIHLVPTYALLADDEIGESRMQRAREVQATNLTRLSNHGGRFLIGTDTRGGVFEEVEYLAGLGTFSNARLLEIIFGTGKALFPHRRIACFDAGCEADFLVLGSNPVTHLAALRTIRLRVKAGARIAQSETELEELR